MSRRGSIRAGAIASAGALVACALPGVLEPSPAPTGEPASLRVELFSGLAAAPRWGAPERVPIEIVLDATTSMQIPIVGRGATRQDAALQLAARYLAALPEETPVGLRVLGLTSGAECGTAVPIASARGRPTAGGVGEGLATLPPSRGESSLPRALDDARRSLQREDAGGGRVVVLSDLEPDCGGDLCQAAAALVEAGVELELVALGEAPPPACLDELASDVPPPVLERPARPRAPSFRAERPRSPGEGRARTLIGLGRVGGEPVELPPGQALVTVELDPPVAVGPLDLAPGQEATIRVLDFPALEPPVREVWVEGAARTDDVPSGAGEP